MTELAPLAITMGEPAGVGPELIAKIWKRRQEFNLPPFAVYGTQNAFKAIDGTLPLQIIDGPSHAASVFDSALPLILSGSETTVTPGELQDGTAPATINALDQAIKDNLSGAMRALVTSPIQKQHLQGAGFDAPGHTEYLARKSGLPDHSSIMMIAASDLRVVPVTIHVPLKDVVKTLTHERIIHAGLVTARELKTKFGIEKPRIAIAGLNPHAGEGGIFGIEEGTHIQPAIWALEDEGINVTGPWPADTLFHAEARKTYDAVLCMYHDQALIPAKTIDFWGGVNVTLGLPIVRTSPDHGTALDQAGQNIARIDSFLNAIKLADQMSSQRTQQS